MQRRRLPFVLALALAAAWIALPIGRGGAWDPYELDTADLARRIGVQAFGWTELAYQGDPDTIPTLTDLGMGELPFTSMAVSFRLFGVNDVSGRLAMAAWAIFGAAAVYLLMRRCSERVAFFSVAILATTPLYALQGRTMLGDAVTLAGFAAACAGLLLLVLSRGRARAAFGALAAAGMLAGFLSRGLLIGVAAPCLSVAAALVVGRDLLPADEARFRRWLAVGLGLAGAAAALRFCQVALPLVDTDAPLDREVGMTLWDPTPNDSTFDRVLRQLGHAAFPWSALMPWAVVRALRPPVPVEPRSGEAFLRVALVCAAAVAFACSTLLVSWAPLIPFVGVVPLAGVVALALGDLDRRAEPSVAGVVSIAAAFALLWFDFTRDPGRTLAPFSLPAAVLPPGWDDHAEAALLTSVGLAAPAAIVALARGDSALPRARADIAPFMRERWAAFRASARAAGRSTVRAFNGNLVFFLVVFEAGLVGLAAMLFIGRRAGWESLAALPPRMVELGTMAWWALPLLSAVLVASAVIGSAAWDLLAGVSRLGRGGLLGVAVAVSGAVLGMRYYPALAAELSPKEVFEAFRAARAPGEELALLGASPRAGSFYAGHAVPAFADEKSAFEWLDAAGEGRRFLVVKARDLPKLNSHWRRAHRENLPVLDAARSDSLLAVSRLDGAPNQNPLADVVLDAEPVPARPLPTRFLDHIDVLGWQVEDPEGRLIDSVTAGEPFRVVFFYRVLVELGDWRAFIHLDGRTRHNADHAPLEGRYPMPLWQPGDIVRDAVDVTLPPNFGPGEIWVFFGFFQGKTRLRVSEGQHRDDRAIAGRITVR